MPGHFKCILHSLIALDGFHYIIAHHFYFILFCLLYFCIFLYIIFSPTKMTCNVKMCVLFSECFDLNAISFVLTKVTKLF